MLGSYLTYFFVESKINVNGFFNEILFIGHNINIILIDFHFFFFNCNYDVDVYLKTKITKLINFSNAYTNETISKT